MSAACGITEPFIFGIMLKYKRIFILSNLGSAIGGLVCGLLKVNNFALSGSLIGIAAFINPQVW
jgi:Phosphotransferase system IIC components, glucose/maltose/N-acetylglucosamine-specific